MLVDEYQDTNRLQAAILLALKPDGRGLTVVGDDAQSIYSFRAATVRNILDFPQQFLPPARVVTLERNYRSTPTDPRGRQCRDRAAPPSASPRTSGPSGKATSDPGSSALRDEADQATYVVEQVLERREAGIALKSQAVLFRTAHHSAQLELELTRRNIPFVKFGGLKFLEAAHIKDVLAVLRWAENPRDRIAGFRLLQLLPGVGPQDRRGRIDRCRWPPSGPARALAHHAVPGAAPADWRGLARTCRAARDRGRHGWPAELSSRSPLVQPHLERLHEDAEVRRADLLQLEQIAAGYPSRERFLTELTLDPPDATSDEAGVPLLDEDYLILSTIHSAKGQEWNAVFLLNAVDGCIPSDLATGSDAESRRNAACSTSP